MQELEGFWLVTLSFFAMLHMNEAGSCWSISKKGQCGQLLKRGVSFDQCCKSNEQFLSKNRLAYSDRDAKSSRQLFFLVFVNRPRVCKPCSDPCAGVRCGVNSRAVCTLTKTRKARCVCNPDCSNTHPGKVCSTDQRTYASECDLLSESCRTRKQIEVDYQSECKESCSGVICPKNKLCVEDQYRIPHCISNAICKSSCDIKPDDEMLCGTNGVTYSSLCALRQVVCQHGVKERVGIAYKGACISHATCEKIKCSGKNKCLTDGSNVRCVKCESFCIGGFHIQKPVCGSDNKTYKNWCSLRRAACSSGKHIEVRKNGKC
ncbi:follistatin-like [Rhopilema esculentum]|uniref:follistatin-like n=1 Tax=Rhopilema esculentum TaxID=499914 RepID=UPI0031E16309